MISPLVFPSVCDQRDSSDSLASSSSSTFTASSASRSVSPDGPTLDPEALWHRYNQHPCPVPQGAIDLASVLYALLCVIRDHDGPSQDRQLHDIAMLLSRHSRLVLPTDPGIRQMAQDSRHLLNAMLAPSGTRGLRTRGVQVALDEFLIHFNTILSAPRDDPRPAMIVKSVPLKEDLLTCPVIGSGVFLGPLQPPPEIILASTPMPSPPTSRDGDRAPRQPLLSIVSAQDRLRLEIAPQSDMDWRTNGGRLQEALTTLERSLVLSTAQGRRLQDAVHRFNCSEDPCFRLTMAPDLPDAIRAAPLLAQTGSGSEFMLWFNYALLVTSGALDRRIDRPAPMDRLNACRRHVQEALETVVSRWSPSLPTATRQFRPFLVAGCAVQLCLEAARQAAPLDTDFHFLVPAHEVTVRMTDTEKALVRAVLTSLKSRYPALDLSAMDRPAHWRPAPTYVSMDQGSPMGCVSLRTRRDVTAQVAPPVAAPLATPPDAFDDNRSEGFDSVKDTLTEAISAAMDISTPGVTSPKRAVARWLNDWVE